MPLTTKQWTGLKPLLADKERIRTSFAKRVGGDAALAELLELGHVARGDGRKLSRTPVSVDAFDLYEALPEDGSGMTNPRAQKASGLGVRRYDKAKALLLSTDEIARGRGRGGTIRRVELSSGSRVGAETEDELYEPVRALIAQEPRPGCTFQTVTVTATGRNGRQRGQWTRPDLVEVTVQDYNLLPGVVVDVHSYEVKPMYAATNLAGVYEASAHQRQAHYSVLVIEWPVDDDPPEPVLQECKRLGVGLATAHGGQFITVLPALRQEPEPAEVNKLLTEALADDANHAKYLRSIGKSAPAADEDGEDDED